MIVSMEKNGVLQRKLSLLDRQSSNLKRHLAGITIEQFRNDWVLRSMAERALQVAVEIVIDIAERIIALEKAGPVATSGEAIKKICELKYTESPDPYLDMVRFRNLIIHEYEEIDPDILFTLATVRLEDFRSFRDELDRKL